MKEKKKPKGTKAEIRAYKKRSRLIGTVIIVAILVVIITISSFLIYSYLNPSNQTLTDENPPDQTLKAAIVDQLNLTFPSQTFNQTATNILKEAGFTVDYCPDEEVTVEFYKTLPKHGYSLIVLRLHSGLKGGVEPPLCLFTSEPYIQGKHGFWEEWEERLTSVAYSEEEAKRGIAYFGITPKFVQKDMEGEFQNTTIIMMGCNGLTYTLMAQAFIEKGAKVYISWDLAVSASHTDTATIQLLTYLTQNQTIKQAVENTMNEVGPDTNNSTLNYYPKTPEVQDYVILNTGSNLILKVAVATTISRREATIWRHQ